MKMVLRSYSVICGILLGCLVAPALADDSERERCGCTDCSFCQGKKPCVDLLEVVPARGGNPGYNAHHYMFLDEPGVAVIDAESRQGGDSREWTCKHYRSSTGLVGKWLCDTGITGNPFYGGSAVQITSETDPASNFLTGRDDDSGRFRVEYCYQTPVTTTTTTTTATTATTTVSTTTNTIDAELNRQQDKYSALELEMEKQILASQNDIAGIKAQMSEMQQELRASVQTFGEQMDIANGRLEALEGENSQLKETLAAAKNMLVVLPLVTVDGEQGVCRNGDGGCVPSVESSANGQDVTISAAMGKVVVDTAECGEVDVCQVRQAVAAANNVLALLADLD